MEIVPFGNGRGVVRGDAFPYRYRFDTFGLTLAEAWLTVKLVPASEADAAALFQKIITTTDVAGTGQIESSGATSGIGVIRFDLTSANTAAGTADTEYTYDVQIRYSNGNIYTIRKGPYIPIDQVTQDV